MKLSEKLQVLRRRAGLSQEQLAEGLNVTRQAVSKWETGEGKPDIDNLLPLARLLGTTADYLLDEAAAEPATETPSVWEQIKALGRRWGYLGGYVLAVIGGVRAVGSLAVLLAPSLLAGGAGHFSQINGITIIEGWSGLSSIGGALVPYYLLGAMQLAINLALLAAGIWLARYLKRKYN